MPICCGRILRLPQLSLSHVSSNQGTTLCRGQELFLRFIWFVPIFCAVIWFYLWFLCAWHFPLSRPCNHCQIILYASDSPPCIQLSSLVMPSMNIECAFTQAIKRKMDWQR
ncbi:hypothetical protein BDV18DRAFT_139509 [Aspergillus unguis]